MNIRYALSITETFINIDLIDATGRAGKDTVPDKVKGTLSSTGIVVHLDHPGEVIDTTITFGIALIPHFARITTARIA